MTYHQNNIEDFKNTARFFEEDTREEIYKNNLAKIFHNIWIELAIWKFEMIFKGRERKGRKKTKRADVMLVPTRTAPIMVTSPNGRI